MRRRLVAMAAMAHGLQPPPEITLAAARQCAAPLPQSTPTIVMGSKSASRRALLEAMGCTSFETRVADVDEDAIGDRKGDPRVLVRAIAAAKCDALLERHFASETSDDVVLVCGDQVVTFEGTVREKPADLDEARRFAQSYSGGACSTVGCIITHDVLCNTRRVDVHEATVSFGAFPETLVDDILASADGPIVLQCAGGLMVEHPLLAPHIKSVEGGVDSIMGLATPVLAVQLQQILEERRAFEEQYPLVHPRLGPVLGRPVAARGRWAVVGDVFNNAKPASRVLAKISDEAAACAAVSPYQKGGLASVADVRGALDAVDLCVSPRIGAREVDALADRGVRFVFAQPGADGTAVLAACRRRGVVVQRGCVLVDEWPS